MANAIAERPTALKLTASKTTRGDWILRSMCQQWHTVFKRMARPEAAYDCPYCGADVR
ncbi:hypothetical protein MUN78_05880 [Leucobacter allii]|uniref:Cold-shock protein n=1 Tax=Leucobacter allii TaxID=2932247 RepID=A0ABY4FQ15_9MICO|nr:hypothetical protein [Leucobacter allii]UOQ58366.1 hypothetical protein MUN78_05880 [Leucobacter allii]UOR02945.1 hypothetical protein MUN77_06490 [Leucobacter allii]